MDKNWRNTVALLAICQLTSCALLSQNKSLVQVVAKSVNPQIETPYSIQCENFEGSFSSSMMKVQTITDTILLREFEDALSSLKYAGADPHIDVRMKIYFYYRGAEMPKIVCLNKFFSIVIDGKLVKGNKNLTELMHKVFGAN